MQNHAAASEKETLSHPLLSALPTIHLPFTLYLPILDIVLVESYRDSLFVSGCFVSHSIFKVNPPQSRVNRRRWLFTVE